MNILVISTRFPFPRDNGFANKNYQLLAGLNKYGFVDFLTISNKIESQFSRSLTEAIVQKHIHFNVKKPEMFKNLLQCLFTGLPLQLALSLSQPAKQFVNNHSKNYDLIIYSVNRGAYLIDYSDSPKNYLCLADSIGDNFLSIAKNESVFKRLFYRFEGKRLLNYEKSLIAKSDKAFFFNPKSISYSQNALVEKKIHKATHGCNLEVFRGLPTKEELQERVVFLGNLSYRPNQQAIAWFLINVWRNGNFDKLQFHIIGSGFLDRTTRTLCEDFSNVKLVGYVEDIADYMAISLCTISPIVSGGGIQNKALESMASSSLTIVSKEVSKSLTEAYDKGVLSGLVVCNQPKDWISAIERSQHLSEENILKRKSGNVFVRDKCDWSLYIDSLLKGNAE